MRGSIVAQTENICLVRAKYVNDILRKNTLASFGVERHEEGLHVCKQGLGHLASVVNQ